MSGNPWWRGLCGTRMEIPYQSRSEHVLRVELSLYIPEPTTHWSMQSCTEVLAGQSELSQRMARRRMNAWREKRRLDGVQLRSATDIYQQQSATLVIMSVAAIQQMRVSHVRDVSKFKADLEANTSSRR